MIDSLAEEEQAPGALVVEARPAGWKDVLRGIWIGPSSAAGTDGRGR